MIYNTIQHDIRNNAGLSMLDYCILEMIYNLSNSGKEMYSTWCNAAKPKFIHLASGRTIVNRFNALEAKGWIEFKDEKRFLKRTTEKYYNDVYVYISGVKKLHSEKVARVKELHPNGEKVAHLGVKKLHTRGEKVAPNKDIDKDTINDIDKESVKDTHIKELENKLENALLELEKLKSQKEKPKKVAPKKGSHEFTDNTPKRTYNPKDMRTNKQLPFDVVSAKKTIDELFPTWQDLETLYDSCYSEKATEEIFKKCMKTFIELGISNYYTGIKQIEVLQKKLLEWVKKEVKFQRNNSNNQPPLSGQSGSPFLGGEDLSHKNVWNQ